MKLLILVDIQLWFLNEHTRAAAAHIERRLPEFDRVHATRFINGGTDAGSNLFHDRLDWHDAPPGSAETLLTAWVTRRADRIVDKTGYTVGLPELFGELWPQVRFPGSDIEVTLAGFNTDACVLALGFSLFSEGIPFVIDAAGCASSSGPALHRSALDIAVNSFGAESVTERIDTSCDLV